MKARIFIFGGEPQIADGCFTEILKKTFLPVLTDNGAVEVFDSLKDATASIGKAFSDSDTLLFFAPAAKYAETKQILCKALGLELRVNEALLNDALPNADESEKDSPFFNVCHAGVVEQSQIFVLRDALYAGFACKRGKQTVIVLPLVGERTRVMLTSQVIPYINEVLDGDVSPAPLQFYYAEKLAESVEREKVKIAVSATKASEVFLRYLSFIPALAEQVMLAAKAEKRGGTPPNEYVVNLSITAAEFLGLPYGVAITNAYYVGDDPDAVKTVYVAVTNDAETTVRELKSFYGESTGDFLFRCCGELCRLLARIIDADAGLGEKVIADETTVRGKKKHKGAKIFIAVLLALILGCGAWGWYYFRQNNYTVKDWANRYLPNVMSVYNNVFGSGETQPTQAGGASEDGSASSESGSASSESGSASSDASESGSETFEAPAQEPAT